jgi:hypothetical protein
MTLPDDIPADRLARCASLPRKLFALLHSGVLASGEAPGRVVVRFGEVFDDGALAQFN